MPTPIRCLYSIHDVVPETLDQVTDLVQRLEGNGQRPISLLVVPGRDWDAAGIAVLKGFAAAGHELAGHGWRHRVDRIVSLGHRLHAALISRDVAEHLALDAAGIAALMVRCRDWFGEHDLPLPSTYVPPAWAMGAIPRAELGRSGFRYFETLTGIYDAAAGRLRRIPLLGYEADTAMRAAAVRLSNRINRGLARRSRLIRLGIHPDDPTLRLADDLGSDLEAGMPAVAVADCFT